MAQSRDRTCLLANPDAACPVAYVFQGVREPAWFYRIPGGPPPHDLNCGYYQTKATAAVAARSASPDSIIVFATPADTTEVRDPKGERTQLLEQLLGLLAAARREARSVTDSHWLHGSGPRRCVPTDTAPT